MAMTARSSVIFMTISCRCRLKAVELAELERRPKT